MCGNFSEKANLAEAHESVDRRVAWMQQIFTSKGWLPRLCSPMLYRLLYAYPVVIAVLASVALFFHNRSSRGSFCAHFCACSSGFSLTNTGLSAQEVDVRKQIARSENQFAVSCNVTAQFNSTYDHIVTRHVQPHMLPCQSSNIFLTQILCTACRAMLCTTT